MQIGGPKCGCGNRGCFEALASRTAIERDLREAVAAGRQTVLTELVDGDLSVIRSNTLRQALELGDPLVTEVLGRAAEVLGYACLTVRHLIDPAAIVLGGGMLEACSDFIMPIVEKIVGEDCLPGARQGGDVFVSALGDDAVVLGAVALARTEIGDDPFKKGATAAPTYPEITVTKSGRFKAGAEVVRPGFLRHRRPQGEIPEDPAGRGVGRPAANHSRAPGAGVPRRPRGALRRNRPDRPRRTDRVGSRLSPSARHRVPSPADARGRQSLQSLDVPQGGADPRRVDRESHAGHRCAVFARNLARALPQRAARMAASASLIRLLQLVGVERVHFAQDGPHGKNASRPQARAGLMAWLVFDCGRDSRRRCDPRPLRLSPSQVDHPHHGHPGQHGKAARLGAESETELVSDPTPVQEPRSEPETPAIGSLPSARNMPRPPSYQPRQSWPLCALRVSVPLAR